MADGDAPSETLDGTLGRVIFSGGDTGFTVARLAVAGATDPVTVVGEMVGIGEGTPLRLHGTWVVDRKWGRQFKIEGYQLRTPETVVGIERFLGSGLIPGVGPELAKRMVAAFGMDTLEVIDRAPERLVEVAGIGAARAGKIAGHWREHRHVQDVMVFLRGHGVSAAFAARIVKRYGKDAINKVRENPYRLALEVWGIGFRTADAIATKLGYAKDDPRRIEAGLVHVLDTHLEDGHTHVPEDVWLGATAELLGNRADLPGPAIALETRGIVVRELLGGRGLRAPGVGARDRGRRRRRLRRAGAHAGALALDVDAALHQFEADSGLSLAPQQRRAVAAAALDKCVVITGGPGVGKTTIVRAIVHLARLTQRRIALAAPTGRAALRLAESTGAEATTLHRLLEYQPQTGAFARERGNPLEVDVVIVDETSMVDVELFRSLLVAMPPRAQLVLVGDIDQLPSVGAGAVLADVIASEAATVVRLTEIFRQAAASQIVVSAHAINAGTLPDLDAASAMGGDPGRDFYFVGRDDPEAARATVVELVAERIPARFGHDPISGIQVLTPMHRGELGTAALNAALQARLNPAQPGAPTLTRGERAFRVGDKIMQLRNDYDRGVFNGDIGVVTAIDAGAATLSIQLTDGRRADYERAELDQLVHAYAVSVHKSQGSEYPAVVIPLATQHYMMLQRSLLYTAVTRGKRLVVLVGSRRAVGMAVRNHAARARHTYLAERIREHIV
ncbi:MAG: ATP-dependent RecD-like DNA helicase [Kofleriaceae bacterium]